MMIKQSSASTVRLRSIGVYLPADRESNLERLDKFGITHQFLENKLGVIERAIKQSDEKTSDLCVKAFQDLNADGEINLDDIQLLSVVTQNPDRKIPHVSAIVHQKLGLSKHCMTFDISQGCAGYTHAMAILSTFMERFGLEHALLFTCDPYSEIIDRNDKNTSLLFGDAASASYFTQTGSGYRLVDATFGTSPNTTTCLQCHDVFEMDGREVFMNAVREVPKSINNLLSRHGLSIEDIDLILLHQGSKYVVDYINQILRVTDKKSPFQIQQYGNTVSSSIPLMLQEPLTQKNHRRVILSGFGVGFSWGSCLMELIA